MFFELVSLILLIMMNIYFFSQNFFLTDILSKRLDYLHFIQSTVIKDFKPKDSIHELLLSAKFSGIDVQKQISTLFDTTQSLHALQEQYIKAVKLFSFKLSTVIFFAFFIRMALNFSLAEPTVFTPYPLGLVMVSYFALIFFLLKFKFWFGNHKPSSHFIQWCSHLFLNAPKCHHKFTHQELSQLQSKLNPSLDYALLKSQSLSLWAYEKKIKDQKAVDSRAQFLTLLELPFMLFFIGLILYEPLLGYFKIQ